MERNYFGNSSLYIGSSYSQLLESLAEEGINKIGRNCPFSFLFKFKWRVFKLKDLFGAVLRKEEANQVLIEKVLIIS